LIQWHCSISCRLWRLCSTSRLNSTYCTEVRAYTQLAPPPSFGNRVSHSSKSENSE
jgi:hypothetical protein